QDALQSELGGENHVGSLSSIERPVSVTATDDLPDLWADAITRCAVKAKSTSDERSAGNRHATFCGSRERVTAPGDPVSRVKFLRSTRQSMTGRLRQIAYAVLSFGGFLSMGDKLFAVPWRALTLDTRNHRFTLSIAKDALTNAPGFD